jgi:ferredoxin-NADP reductase
MVGQARLLQAIEVAPETRHFFFSVEGEASFPFQPGQFVSLSAEIGGRKITRAYSLGSVPTANNFEICLNRVADGIFSPWLFARQPGDLISFSGPVGTFTLRSTEHPVIFIATGTGVVPFRGMLREASLAAGQRPVTLIFGSRYESGVLWRNEFEAFAADNPWFHFLPTLTRPSAEWMQQPGRAEGRVQPLLLNELAQGGTPEVYVCGMKEMVDDVRTILKERGFDRKHIIYEKYD